MYSSAGDYITVVLCKVPLSTGYQRGKVIDREDEIPIKGKALAKGMATYFFPSKNYLNDYFVMELFH